MNNEVPSTPGYIFSLALPHSSMGRTQKGQYPEGFLREGGLRETQCYSTPGVGKASWGNAVWGAKVLFVSVIAFITDGAIDSEERLTDGRQFGINIELLNVEDVEIAFVWTCVHTAI